MGATNINITYRPLRIGFLVRDGEVKDLVNSARVNSLLWGGIYNPVIPVGKNLNFSKDLIKLFSVNNLFAIDNSINETHIKDIYPHFFNIRRKSHLNLSDNDWQLIRKQSQFLDIINIIDHIWNTRVHAWPETKKSHYWVLKWDSEDLGSDIFTIIFGAFPIPGSIFEENFFKGLHGQEVIIAKSKAIDPAILKYNSLLQLTNYRLTHIPAFTHYEAGLYIGKQDCFEDLLAFWNLRAAGIRIRYFNYDHYDRWDNYVKVYLKELDRQPVVRKFINKHIGIYYSALDKDKIQELEKSFDLNKKFRHYKLSEHSWNGLHIIPDELYLQQDSVLANVDKSNGGYKVSMELPHRWFVDRDTAGGGFERFVVEFVSFTEFDYPFHTMKLPYLMELTKDLGMKLSYRPHEFNIGKNGISLSLYDFGGPVSLYPLAYDDLVKKIFDLRGIKAEISQPGILAKRIIEQLGELEDARVFKIKGIRKLIKVLTSQNSINKKNTISHICDNGSFRQFESLYIEKRKGGKLTAYDAFNFLLKKGLFRGGLEFKCDNCKLINWLPLKQIDDFWICEYCGNKHQTNIFLTGNQSEWKFRKSGLLAKDNNQEGAIPVILTLLQFNRWFEFGGFVFSPAMNLTDGDIKCETDLCILQYQRSNQTVLGHTNRLEIGIGECKDEGGLIDRKDIENLRHIYEKLKGEDIDCYLIFSKTAEKFEPEEFNLFKKLKQEKIPVILFTNVELEPFYPDERHIQERAGWMDNTLQGIADLSAAVYLA